MSFSYESIQHGSVLVVRLEGELDHHSATQLRNKLEEELNNKEIIHLVLNLKKLTMMDSSGIGVILGRYRLIESRKGQVLVCFMNPTVYRVMELTGMFKILTVIESEADALAKLGVA